MMELSIIFVSLTVLDRILFRLTVVGDCLTSFATFPTNSREKTPESTPWRDQPPTPSATISKSEEVKSESSGLLPSLVLSVSGIRVDP